MKTWSSLVLSLFLMPLVAQKWTLANLKHFTGTGYQTVEAVVAGSAVESFLCNFPKPSF
jgi:hypothetical protein